MTIEGVCGCGCGGLTSPAPFTCSGRGWVKDQPVRYLQGHHAKSKGRSVCSVESCSRYQHGKGLCQMHYQRQRRGGSLEAPSRVMGSGTVDARGYKTIYRGGKRILEHRAVMEDYLGRELLPGETVHHKGSRDDNRIEMLELRVAAHGPGWRIDEAVSWATEILNRYA